MHVDLREGEAEGGDGQLRRSRAKRERERTGRPLIMLRLSSSLARMAARISYCRERERAPRGQRTEWRERGQGRTAHQGNEEHPSLLQHVEASPHVANPLEALAHLIGSDAVLFPPHESAPDPTAEQESGRERTLTFLTNSVLQGCSLRLRSSTMRACSSSVRPVSPSPTGTRRRPRPGSRAARKNGRERERDERAVRGKSMGLEESFDVEQRLARRLDGWLAGGRGGVLRSSAC